MDRPDDEREVDLDEDLAILPDDTHDRARDAADVRWSARADDGGPSLLDERPPHWEHA